MRTLSQAVKPGHQGMMYECGVFFKRSDLHEDYINNPHHNTHTLPIINETCSDQVGMTTTYIKTTSSSMASKTKKPATTISDAMLTTGKSFIFPGKIRK